MFGRGEGGCKGANVERGCGVGWSENQRTHEQKSTFRSQKVYPLSNKDLIHFDTKSILNYLEDSINII